MKNQFFKCLAVFGISSVLVIACQATDNTDTTQHGDGNTIVDIADALTNTEQDIAVIDEGPSLGLKSPAKITFDTYGVPHIHTKHRTDALFLQGWVTAKQRIFQMDYMRRQAMGTRAEVYGPSWLEDDKTKRILGLATLAKETTIWTAKHHPAVFAEIQSYVAGVNAWLMDARSGKESRPAELDRIGTDYWPTDWTPEDVIAVSKLIILASSFHADQEVLGVAATVLLGEETFRDLFRFQPMMPTYATEPGPGDESRFPHLPGKADSWTPASGFSIHSPIAARFAHLSETQRLGLGTALIELAKRLATLRGVGLGSASGSNSYAVASERTKSGHAMLCNEFHQPVEAPNRFHAVHMVVDDSDPVGLFGYTVPGLPYVLGGHTGKIAFGITAAFADVTDLYAEVKNDTGDAVLFHDEWVPIVRRVEKIAVRPDGGDWKTPDIEEFTVDVVPHHGPIINGLLPPDMALLLNATGLVLSARWPGFSAETRSPVALSALTLAQDLDQARAALNYFDDGPMNWTLADSQGDIGYTNAGPWPVRPWDLLTSPPWEPLEGTGLHEWSHIDPPSMALDDLRPEKGYHVDANGAMTTQNMDGNPLNDDRYFQHFADLGTRAWQITDRIETAAANSVLFDLPTLQNIQADTFSVFAHELLPILLAQESMICGSAAGNGDACEAFGYLKTWDYRLARGSAGATLFNIWLNHLVHRILAQRLSPLVLGVVGGFLFDIGARDVVAWHKNRAPAPAVNWFDNPKTVDVVETFEDHARLALTEATDQLRQHFGDTNMSEWHWERLHELAIHHIVYPDQNVGPYPLDGGPATVHVSGYSGTESDGSVKKFPLVSTEGAVFRFCVKLADKETENLHVLAGGQEGHSGSQHETDQLALWLNHLVISTPLSQESIEAAATNLRVFDAGYGAP
ncbi:MAG: penicillin acylase family protein [Myxococcales bacterium]|nr:penicillin acylase family protein [Myxococcales bacterium]